MRRALERSAERQGTNLGANGNGEARAFAVVGMDSDSSHVRLLSFYGSK